MNDLPLLLLVALICILIGYMLSSLFSNLRPKKLKEKKAEQVPHTPGEEKIEIARLYRTAEKGELLLEINGQGYRAAGQLSQAQRELLRNVIEELRAWLTPQKEPSISAKVPDTSAPHKAPLTEKPKSPNLNPVDVFARALWSDTHKSSEAPKSIAAQIDAILQEKLASPDLPPSFNERAIRLMELPGKGMVVMVGLDQYNGVDAVPNPEIQNLIRSCVAEWEQGFSSSK